MFVRVTSVVPTSRARENYSNQRACRVRFTPNSDRESGFSCTRLCLLYPPKRTSKSCVDHPGSNACWVSAKDELSLSLLQVRLIDLRMPIKIVQGV